MPTSTADVTQIAIGRDEHRLKTIARAFIDDYPDIHGLAYAEARKLLVRLTGQSLDPDTVYWHRFATAVSSLKTFTGWQHSGPPVESMTFVELMIRRFSVEDLSASDEPSSYGGFYRGGPQQLWFDERNEVAVLPRQTLDDFWTLDFNRLFTARMERFWALHRENFCTLARSAFLASAGSQMLKGRLSIEQFKLVTETVIGQLQPVMTFETLRAGVTPRAGLTLRTFDIGGYACTESFRIIDGTGQQFLYLPGDTNAFHVFASDKALYEWVQERLLDTSPAAAIFKQFFIRSAERRQLYAGDFDEHARQILDTPWVAGQTLINSSDFAIKGDVFAYLRGLAREQMRGDSQILLTSDTRLRRPIWLGYLNAFTHTSAAQAPLGWPMALLMVGASLDQALNARDSRQRKAGLIRSVFGVLHLVSNLTILVGMSRAGAGNRSVGSAVLPNAPQTIALIEHNPSLHPAELINVHSSFWSIYMQLNIAEEKRLSQVALARQKTLMHVPQLSPNDLIAQDLQGHPVYIDEWGDMHRIYKKPDGQYVGGRIPLYSDTDMSFNQYLRTGISTGPEQVDLIDELADDLHTVGFDNSVTLYRGGSELRGTSGRFFRDGQVKSGDVLVSTDILSFSENPYVARVFCSTQAGEHSASFAQKGVPVSFNDTSVVYELPAKNYLGATPVAPFSTEPDEAESIFLPGRYFLIDDIHQVFGPHYRFIKVRLIEIASPKIWHKLYDLRTGEPFTRERYATKLAEQGRRLVDRFFPHDSLGLSF
ncbi:hypothetical protein K5D32_09560 [Pseudomonas cichorii]|uniref:dermonecrotic toxin domain-containing protein n=1 Tax=Pseudomonas cichorii TaxID=36746 RepID=UPI001C895038|nr:DUF6543 domain-containing protein [Pseudomonas cichorii]MBX8529906.1 hypothetical protein [Pseudomonas cichorii]